MKKALFTLGAFALLTLGLAACGDDTKDCACVVTYNGSVSSLTTEVNDFDGDCEDVKASDLEQKYQDLDVTKGDLIVCTEK